MTLLSAPFFFSLPATGCLTLLQGCVPQVDVSKMRSPLLSSLPQMNSLRQKRTHHHCVPAGAPSSSHPGGRTGGMARSHGQERWRMRSTRLREHSETHAFPPASLLISVQLQGHRPSCNSAVGPARLRFGPQICCKTPCTAPSSAAHQQNTNFSRTFPSICGHWAVTAPQ